MNCVETPRGCRTYVYGQQQAGEQYADEEVGGAARARSSSRAPCTGSARAALWARVGGSTAPTAKSWGSTRFGRSLALFIAVEVVLLFWIRDSLLLNVLMLIYPVERIAQWQTGY